MPDCVPAATKIVPFVATWPAVVKVYPEASLHPAEVNSVAYKIEFDPLSAVIRVTQVPDAKDADVLESAGCKLSVVAHSCHVIPSDENWASPLCAKANH